MPTPAQRSALNGAKPRMADGSVDMKIKMSIEFTVAESGLEDALAEFDELTVEGLLHEILDKSIACDEIATKVIEGPNTLEEYDSGSP